METGNLMHMIDLETPVNFPGAPAGDAAVRLEGPPAVCWEQATRVGLNSYWILEPVRGSMGAELGTPIQDWRRAIVRVSLRGPIHAAVRRGGGRLDLELFAAASSVCSIQVRARYESGQPEDSPDLLLRLLGVADWGSLFLRFVEGEAPLDSAPRHFRQRLLELIPTLETGTGAEQVRHRIAPVVALCEQIWREALSALEQRYLAAIKALLARNEDTPLFVATFDPTEEGAARCERARQGDFREILTGDSIVARHLPLSRAIPDESAVELHLPSLNRTDWKFLIERLQSMEVRVDELGRVLAFLPETAAAAAERWNLQQAGLLLAESLPRPSRLLEPRPLVTFSDQRRLSGPQARHVLPRLLEALGFPGRLREELEQLGDVDVRLTLATPVSARPWLEAPRPRSPEFYEVFGEVSRALQRSLRVWAPYVYFSDLRRFDDVEGARAMLVYQATRPSPRTAGTDLTYDVMNLESVHRALRTAGAVLPEILRSVYRLLGESGREETAAYYRRQNLRKIVHSVKRRPRWFQCLLTVDSRIVREVTKLAMATRTLQDEPAEIPRRLHRLVEDFVDALHHRFRRLYGRFACVSLGSLVVVEAARAMASASGQPAPLEVILRLTPPGGPGVEHVFVNDGCRR
jgi:hypothetical protein